MRTLCLAAALAAAFSVHAAEPTAPPPGGAAAPAAEPAPSVEAGRRAYVSSCARCHGINLVVSSSAFFDLRTFPKDQKARFVQSVTHGVRQMPAWGGVVKPGTMDSLWLYLGSVNGW